MLLVKLRNDISSKKHLNSELLNEKKGILIVTEVKSTSQYGCRHFTVWEEKEEIHG